MVENCIEFIGGMNIFELHCKLELKRRSEKFSHCPERAFSLLKVPQSRLLLLIFGLCLKRFLKPQVGPFNKEKALVGPLP